jgi:hypothetical protein
MIEHYGFAKQAILGLDTVILNATVGGNLEVFERVDYNDLFAKSHKKLTKKTLVIKISKVVSSILRPYPKLHKLALYVSNKLRRR